MHVVDAFKIVQIKKQSSYIRVIPARAFDLVNQELAQVTRIMQSGEFIGERKPLSVRDAG